MGKSRALSPFDADGGRAPQRQESPDTPE